MIIDSSLMMTLLNGWPIIYRPETVDIESRVTMLMVLDGILSASFNFIPFLENKHQSVRSQTFGCKFFKNVSNGIVISRPIFHDETSILS